LLAGDITGELVYVNYGRVEDVEELQQLGVNLTGIQYNHRDRYL
jgi:hypothetical protein